MAFIVKVHRDVEKQLRRIPKNHREYIVSVIRSLRNDPRPVGCVKLDNLLYRIRQGQYRIIYTVFDSELVVVVCKTAKRSEAAYRDLGTLVERAEKLLGKR